MEELGSKLRSLRKVKGLTLKQLAEKVECPVSYLSMVENGKVEPSLSRLKEITDALETTIVDLLKEENSMKVVIHQNQRQCIKHPRAKAQNELLVPQIPDRQLDLRLTSIHPEGSSEGSYSHPGEECGLVLKGSLELTVDNEKYDLEVGDSFYFFSNKKHSWRNKGNEDVVIVWVNHPPSW
jgi:transcriptional regulator with XRE-family HTH domain